MKVVAAETPWLEARQRFKSGDVSGARSLAQACARKHAECRALDSGIDVLEARSKNLESLRDGDLLMLFKLDAEPGHPGAQAILHEGRQISTDLYFRAYQLRDTDQPEALKLFKEVVAMTPPDDPNHGKAKGDIDRFERR